MGLGSFLKKAVKSFAPVVSTVAPFFGPVGMGVGAVAAALGGGGGNGGAQSPVMAATPQFNPPFSLPGGATTSIGGLPMALPIGAPQLGGILPAIGGTLGRILPGAAGLVGGAVRAAAGLVRTAAGKIRGVVLASGRFVSSRKAALLAKRVGIDAAAAALGVSAVELAEMVLAEQERAGRRRSRGVSAADLRRTRRTIGTIERMHRQIVSACHDARVPTRRRSAPPFVAAHRHKLVSVK